MRHRLTWKSDCHYFSPTRCLCGRAHLGDLTLAAEFGIERKPLEPKDGSASDAACHATTAAHHLEIERERREGHTGLRRGSLGAKAEPHLCMAGKDKHEAKRLWGSETASRL